MIFSRRLPVIFSAKCYADVATTSKTANIKIPTRIKRSPTAILEALAASVGHDPTGKPSGFIDDSRLAPITSFDNIQFLLAKEQGRKTARKIASDWPTLFMYDKDAPIRNAYRPPFEPSIEEQTSTSIDDLELFMKYNKGTQCAKIVNNMFEAKIAIPQHIKTSLLKLLADHNCSDAKFDLSNYGAHLWFRNIVDFTESDYTKVWNNDNAADRLFDSIDTKNVEHYEIMIRNLVKYQRPARAMKLYENMIKANLTPSTVACNFALLSQVKTDNPWPKAEAILKEMAAKGVKPDAGTFEVAMILCKNTDDADRCINILGESIALGVQPSLYTIAKLIDSMRTDPRLFDLICQSIEYFESLDLINASTIDVSYDAEYFIQALKVLHKRGDVVNAKRLIEIVDKNSHLITEFIANKQIYYSYLRLIINFEKEALNITDTFVRYVPSVLPYDNDILELIRLAVRSCLQLGKPEAITKQFLLSLEIYPEYIPAIVFEIIQQNFNLFDNGETQRQLLLDSFRYYNETLVERSTTNMHYLSNGKDGRLDPLTLIWLVLIRAKLGENPLTVWKLIETIDVDTKIWLEEERKYAMAVKRRLNIESRSDVFLMILDWMCEHGQPTFTQNEIFQKCVHLKKLASLNGTDMKLFIHEAIKIIEKHLTQISNDKREEEFNDKITTQGIKQSSMETLKKKVSSSKVQRFGRTRNAKKTDG